MHNGQYSTFQFIFMVIASISYLKQYMYLRKVSKVYTNQVCMTFFHQIMVMGFLVVT